MSEIIIAILATLGALFALLAGIGVVRMPDTYLRISVTTKAATLGTGLMLAASALYFNTLSVNTRAAVIILFIFLTTPVSAHIIARAAYRAGNKMWDQSIIDELEEDVKSQQENGD